MANKLYTAQNTTEPMAMGCVSPNEYKAQMDGFSGPAAYKTSPGSRAASNYSGSTLNFHGSPGYRSIRSNVSRSTSGKSASSSYSARRLASRSHPHPVPHPLPLAHSNLHHLPNPIPHPNSIAHQVPHPHGNTMSHAHAHPHQNPHAHPHHPYARQNPIPNPQMNGQTYSHAGNYPSSGLKHSNPEYYYTNGHNNNNNNNNNFNNNYSNIGPTHFQCPPFSGVNGFHQNMYQPNQFVLTQSHLEGSNIYPSNPVCSVPDELQDETARSPSLSPCETDEEPSSSAISSSPTISTSNSTEQLRTIDSKATDVELSPKNFYGVNFPDGTSKIFYEWDDFKAAIEEKCGISYEKFDDLTAAEDFTNVKRTSNYSETEKEKQVEEYLLKNSETNLNTQKTQTPRRVYTSGSYIKSGKGGVGVFYGIGDYRNVSETIRGANDSYSPEVRALHKALQKISIEIDKYESTGGCGIVFPKYEIYPDSESAVQVFSHFGGTWTKEDFETRKDGAELQQMLDDYSKIRDFYDKNSKMFDDHEFLITCVKPGDGQAEEAGKEGALKLAIDGCPQMSYI